jgi:hypothetical protein
MRKVVQFLLFASRGLAVCAVLAGLGAGLFEATFDAGFVCFDTCPSRLAITALGTQHPIFPKMQSQDDG